MIRALLFIAVLLAIATAIAMLADLPGVVSINWLGWQVEAPTLIFLLLMGLFLCIVLGLYRLGLALFTLPRRLREKRVLQHHEQGLSLLTETFAALTVGDIAAARKLNQKTEKLLPNAPINWLVAAQIAQLEGDEEAFSRQLVRLKDHKETKFLAAQGQLQQARRAENSALIIETAQEARAIKPDSSYAAVALVDVYLREGRWQEAELALQQARKKRALDKQEVTHYTAILHYLHGYFLYEREEFADAKRYASKAHSLAPESVPFTLLLARIYDRLGKKRAIQSVLTECWRYAPHPSLAALLHQLFAGEDAKKRLKRTIEMVSKQPNHSESHLAIAEAAKAAGENDLARKHARAALETRDNKRACAIKEQLELEEGKDEALAADWRKRGASAPADPEWICEECKTTHASWHPHCPTCHAFDTIRWRTNHIKFAEATQLASKKSSAILGIISSPN